MRYNLRMMHEEIRVLRSHATDDFEKLRTRQVRSTMALVEKLSNGLTALERGRPQVTKERMEHAIADLRNELLYLQQVELTI